jgi:hypothetical protein
MATNELIEANGDQLLTSQEIHELRKAGASAQVRLFFLSISLTELMTNLGSVGDHREADREASGFPPQDRLLKGKVPKAKGAKVGLLGLWFLI